MDEAVRIFVVVAAFVPVEPVGETAAQAKRVETLRDLWRMFVTGYPPAGGGMPQRIVAIRAPRPSCA
jgi:hypothetical protein